MFQSGCCFANIHQDSLQLSDLLKEEVVILVVNPGTLGKEGHDEVAPMERATPQAAEMLPQRDDHGFQWIQISCLQRTLFFWIQPLFQETFSGKLGFSDATVQIPKGKIE